MSMNEGSARRSALRRALAALGPLESRIMRAVWSGAVPTRFVVREVQELMPELAYTTVMTTVNRLAEKGLLHAKSLPQMRAHQYRVAMTPEEFLSLASRHQAEQLVQRYGEAALAAFAAQLDRLSPGRRSRLRQMGRR